MQSAWKQRNLGGTNRIGRGNQSLLMAKTRSARNRSRKNTATVFERRNYTLLLLGIGVVVLGYVLMRVENQVDGFISLYLAPILILGGYLEVIYAILWQPKKTD